MATRRNRLISTAIAAEILGFSPDYVRRMCADGTIKAEKVGHDWVMYERSIINIKRQRKVKDERSSE